MFILKKIGLKVALLCLCSVLGVTVALASSSVGGSTSGGSSSTTCSGSIAIFGLTGTGQTSCGAYGIISVSVDLEFELGGGIYTVSDSNVADSDYVGAGAHAPSHSDVRRLQGSHDYSSNQYGSWWGTTSTN